TKVLLEAVGVPSYYTVLYGDRAKWDIKKDFASFQGNHVILGIPDGDTITWLECTSQDTPYGYIGNFTDDRDVLIITPEGGKIVHTKVYETQDNLQDNKIKVTIDAHGNVRANYESISSGLQYDNSYLLPKQKQVDIDKHYKNKWSYINGFSLIDFEFDNDREEIVFTEKVSLSIPGYASPVGNGFLFCANIFNQSQHIPPRIDDRKQNLYIDYGYVDVDTVVVEIPHDFTVEGLPEEIILETKFGKYEMGFTKTADNNLRYSRKI